jgi:hypothetical protein
MSMSKRARARSRPRPTSCRPTRTRACRTARSKARTWWVETIAATIAAARQCEVIVVELGASNTVSDRGLVHGQGSKQLRLGLRVAPLLDPDLGLVAQVGGKDCRVRIVLGIGSDRLFQQGTAKSGRPCASHLRADKDLASGVSRVGGPKVSSVNWRAFSSKGRPSAGRDVETRKEPRRESACRLFGCRYELRCCSRSSVER